MLIYHRLSADKRFLQKVGKRPPKITGAVKNRTLITPGRGHHLDMPFPVPVYHNELKGQLSATVSLKSYPKRISDNLERIDCQSMGKRCPDKREEKRLNHGIYPRDA